MNRLEKATAGWRVWQRVATVAGGLTIGAAALSPIAHAAPARQKMMTWTAVAEHKAATQASCPKVPARPPRSTAYRTSGYRWNPSETIYYRVDTARLKSAQVKARVADVKRAMRAEATYTGFNIRYLGTESKLRSATKHNQLVQFEYAFLPGGEGVTANLYNYSGTKQMFSAVVDVQVTTATGYGGYDTKHPDQSAEGHLLMFGTGLAMGLNEVKTDWREVMNPVASKRFYYSRYQHGDKFGLWKVGVSAGCSGFSH